MSNYNSDAIRSIAAAVLEIIHSDYYAYNPIVVLNTETMEAHVQSDLTPVDLETEAIIYGSNRVTPDWCGDFAPEDITIDDMINMVIDDIINEDWVDLVRCPTTTGDTQ